jgi:hypothetical protein
MDTDRQFHTHGSIRGAVIVETAVVTAAILTLVLGAIELGVLGFIQITVDAGAFLNAHYNAIGATSIQASNATVAVFPQIKPASISANLVAAATPDPSFMIDYGFSAPNASSNRHGGASMMQPYLQQTTIQQPVFSLLGLNFQVQSSATEANWQESNQEYNLFGNTYGGTGTNLNNITNTANYFSAGENTPYYYLSANYMASCASGGSWGNPSSGSAGNCPSPIFHALGMGEHVENWNWGNANGGVSGPTYNYSNPTYLYNTGVFEEMACHERMFVNIDQFFSDAAAKATAAGTDPLNYLEYYYNPYYGNQNSGATAHGTPTWTFFNSDVQTAKSSLDAEGSAASTAITNVYSWDYDWNGDPGLEQAPGQYPLNPGGGCT